MMAPRPSEVEQQGRLALADLIEKCKDEIIDRWLKCIEVDFDGCAEPVQLRDAMPDYLAHLVCALRSREPSLQKSGSETWMGIAREHALTRVRLGFDVDQLVHEFIVLRRVLTEVGQTNELDINLTQAARIADLIESAVAAAVRSYVDARDYSARKKEAEHIAFLSHELRNPLTAVRLASERLRRAPTGQTGRILDVLERNVNRLAHLIDGVLETERLEAGKVRVQATSISLGDLLGASLTSARLAADAKHLHLTTEFEPDLILWADPDLTRSAISNVFDNAIKYTDEGEVHVAAEATSDRVTLHVRDNCQGLSEEELRVVFEPFERGSSRKPGSGLGLAIARRALEAQKGSIGADSNGERGCHFWISLPRARQ
jgi:signal transduction histidine kinase